MRDISEIRLDPPFAPVEDIIFVVRDVELFSALRPRLRGSSPGEFFRRLRGPRRLYLWKREESRDRPAGVAALSRPAAVRRPGTTPFGKSVPHNVRSIKASLSNIFLIFFYGKRRKGSIYRFFGRVCFWREYYLWLVWVYLSVAKSVRLLYFL